ncbi:helix-turn-helix domain-containing protein [Achromobacter xylosoxidans]
MAAPYVPMLIRAKEAAAILGVSLRTAYALAAPGGPIPCYRIGRTLSFALADLEAYLQTCKHEPLPKPVSKPGNASIRLKASDPRGESNLVKLFRSHGITPKIKR